MDNGTLASMLGHATLRFYGDLADIAWDVDRSGVAQVPVDRARSAKDAVESCGVPHTEVDLLLLNGRSAAFAETVRAGDRLSVYPPFHTFDVPSLVRPAPLDAPRFVLDVHLGRLARRLRVLGIDSAYRNDAGDDELAAESVRDRRWLLTRDRGLLMRATVEHGYLVRSSNPAEQVFEVVRRFALYRLVRPLSRCARCNATLEPVDKAEIEHRLEPGTRRDHDVFVRCSGCDQLYWEGSHVGELHAFIAEVAASAD